MLKSIEKGELETVLRSRQGGGATAASEEYEATGEDHSFRSSTRIGPSATDGTMISNQSQAITANDGGGGDLKQQRKSSSPGALVPGKSFQNIAAIIGKQSAEIMQRNQADSTLYFMIVRHDWCSALAYVEQHPDSANYVDPKRGWYPLHLVCYLGSSPSALLEAVLEGYPDAVNVCDRHHIHSSTPLHIQCRNSQRQSKKVRLLLKYANVAIRNTLGQTALHTACCANAELRVLQLLLEKDRSSLVHIHDYQGETPLAALWQSFLQSIPGSFAVAKVLNSKKTAKHPTNLFSRFWEKFQLLALNGRPPEQLALAIVQQGDFACKMLLLVLRQKPWLATNTPGLLPLLISHPSKYLCASHASSPLHNSLNLHKKEILKLMLDSETASTPNAMGRTPLVLSILHAEDCHVRSILGAATATVGVLDAVSGLYPCQLAASCDRSVDVILGLLLQHPEVVTYALLDRDSKQG